MEAQNRKRPLYKEMGDGKRTKGKLGGYKRNESNLKAAATLCDFSAKNQRAIVRRSSQPLNTLFRRQRVIVVVTGSVCSENRRL